MISYQQSIDYASKRSQAERNVKDHIDDVLTNTVKSIAIKTNIIKTVTSKEEFKAEVYKAAENDLKLANRIIANYITEYSKASIKVLGDKDTGALTRMLNGKLFGKTFKKRNDTYMSYFANDVTNLLYACRVLEMNADETQKALLQFFKDPYTSDVIARANKKNSNIATPEYGRGIYHSAYENVVRNAQGTIALVWQKELGNYAKRSGALMFTPHRGSSYICPLCDSYAERSFPIDTWDENAPLYHSRCKCYVTFN